MFRVIPQLTVQNVILSNEFYVANLGFTVDVLDPLDAPVFASLTREDANIFLVSKESRNDAGKIEDLEIYKAGVGVKLFFEVDDAKLLYDELRSRSVKIGKELSYNSDEDYTEFSIYDPDGYEIGIYS